MITFLYDFLEFLYLNDRSVDVFSLVHWAVKIISCFRC